MELRIDGVNVFNPLEGKLDDRAKYRYSGCLDGRGFDECGVKGFYVLDTDTGADEFVPMSSRVIYEFKIDVTNLNMTEIQSTISDLTNIEPDKLRIRVDINDKDEVIHIIVIVDDMTRAKLIKDAIEKCANHQGE